MPNRCNVANCTSNYDGTEYTPVFEMLNHWPKEVQDEWRKFLHRDDAWQLTRVFICAKHFSEKDLLLTVEIPQSDGSINKFPRKPGLHKGAKPTLLPNCPSYLQSQNEPAERLDRDEIDIRHFHRALELSIAEHQTENEKYSVITIDEVQQKYSILNLNEEWFYIRSSQSSLHIFKKILSGHLLIMSHQIIFNEELNVECFHNEVPIRTRISKITDIRQISELLQDIDTYQKPDEIEIEITKAIKSVEYIIGKLTDNEDTTMHNSQTLLSRLQFILHCLDKSIRTPHNSPYK